MTEREKKLWGWAGKLLLVAVPAAISGYTSYKKSEVEAKTRSEASYTALRTAFEAQQKDFEELQRHSFVIDGQVEMLKELCSKPKTVSVAPMPVPLINRPDAGADGDGLPDVVAKKRKKFHAADVALPAKFDDMMMQYAPKK